MSNPVYFINVPPVVLTQMNRGWAGARLTSPRGCIPSQLPQTIKVDPLNYRTKLGTVARPEITNPFKLNEAVRGFVSGLFDRYNPKTQMDKAILLFRSVLPVEENDWERICWKNSGIPSRALSLEEGGLNIVYSNDPNHPIRSRSGAVLPEELIIAVPKDRAAACLEYSDLLVSVLRAAGFQAGTKETVGHTAVIAVIAGQKYLIDAVRMIFERTEENASSENEGRAYYFFNRGANYLARKMYGEAIEANRTAIELNPYNFAFWNNLGKALIENDRIDEAIGAFSHAISLNPESDQAWENRAWAKTIRYFFPATREVLH